MDALFMKVSKKKESIRKQIGKKGVNHIFSNFLTAESELEADFLMIFFY